MLCLPLLSQLPGPFQVQRFTLGMGERGREAFMPEGREPCRCGVADSGVVSAPRTSEFPTLKRLCSQLLSRSYMAMKCAPGRPANNPQTQAWQRLSTIPGPQKLKNFGLSVATCLPVGRWSPSVTTGPPTRTARAGRESTSTGRSAAGPAPARFRPLLRRHPCCRPAARSRRARSGDGARHRRGAVSPTPGPPPPD